MARDLNRLFRISFLDSHQYRLIDIAKLNGNPIKKGEDWSQECFTSLKRYFRKQHYQTQQRRCAYCRRQLNPLGINEHIDHIVARSIKPGWMFKPRNLVLTCYQCNTQKTNHSALKHNKHKRLPRRKRHYTLYNPYVHRWYDHFEIEDNLFIKAKSKIGSDTISKLKLYDFKYSMIYSQESNVSDASAIKRATTRLVTFKKGSIEYKSALRLIKEIERHI